jgi:hypothetical protein
MLHIKGLGQLHLQDRFGRHQPDQTLSLVHAPQEVTIEPAIGHIFRDKIIIIIKI